jgi:hypothetical protein
MRGFRPALRWRHGFGLAVIAAFALARFVPATANDPATLRNYEFLAFDLAFMAPWLVAEWRGRKPTAAVGLPTANQGVGLGFIALAAGLSFAACWGFAPSEAIAWLVPRLAVVAGFGLRWAAMTAESAASQCARNRARFGAAEMLSKAIDRGIIVLFVATLPMAWAAGAEADPEVLALAQAIVAMAGACRSLVLLVLGGFVLDWAIAEVAVRRRRAVAGVAARL